MRATTLSMFIVKPIFLFLVLGTGLLLIIGSLQIFEDVDIMTRYILSRVQSPFYRVAYASDHSNPIEGIKSLFMNGRTHALGHASSVPVLIYHGVTEESEESSINVSRGQFKEQMFALKRAGYETITLDELYSFISNKSTVPERSFVLTFDDGRSDSFYGADPILAALGYNASMFVITEYNLVEHAGYYLSLPELERMVGTGRWEIGSHSKAGHDRYPTDREGKEGNFFGNKIWLRDKGRLETDDEFKNRIVSDLIDSREALKMELSVPVTTFAFPSGDFGQLETNFPQAKRVVLENAHNLYKMLFYQFQSKDVFTHSHPSKDEGPSFLVRRTTITSDVTGEDLVEFVRHGEHKSLPYTDNFSTNNGWIVTWGNALTTVSESTPNAPEDLRITGLESNQNAMLKLSAPPSQAGSVTVLDGTYLWKDYSVRAIAHTPVRSSIVIMARFQDNENFAECNFGNGFVHVEQMINGKKNVLQGVRSDALTIPDSPTRVEVRVSGRTIQCIMNDRVIVETPFLDTKLTHGGIGFKTWDHRPNYATLNITSLSVTPIATKN